MNKDREIERLIEKIAEVTADCSLLADAILSAEGVLRNDLYSSRVNNALATLDEVQDTAIDYMTDGG